MKNCLTKKIRFLIFTALTIVCLSTSTPDTVCGQNPGKASGPTLSNFNLDNEDQCKPAFKTSGRLIVELKTNPLAHQYATAPREYGGPGARRLGLQNDASQQHLRVIEREQDGFIKRLRSLATDIRVSRHQDSKGNLRKNRYQLLFNGLSLDPGRTDRKTLLQELRALPEVKAVYPDRAYYPNLYSSRDLINTQALWNNPVIVSSANAGRGIKIAVLDGGIHHLAPMFSGSGFQYPPDIPAPGIGDTSNNNGKIIASRAYFRPDDPPEEGDENVWPGENGTSHGVHVAGTVSYTHLRAHET